MHADRQCLVIPIFVAPGGHVEWEVQLSNSYFQLSRAVGQSLMSIPDMLTLLLKFSKVAS